MPGSRSRPEGRVARHVREAPRSGIRAFFDLVSATPDVISLGIGEPDFDTPWSIREAAVYALEHGATHYSANAGLPKLRRAIAGYVGRTFGVAYDPESEILVTAGVSQGLDLAVRALLDPGDEALYPEPSYVAYGPLVAFAHGRPVAVPARAEAGFRIEPEALAARTNARTRLLLLNYPNNPTGAALPRPAAEALAAFACARDLTVVSDEIYAELTYDGEPHTCLAALPGMRERTVLLHGFSKSWAMTGFRIGYACGPAPMIAAMTKIHQYSMLCAATPVQEAAAAALAGPGAEVAAMREAYEARRNYARSALADLGLPCSRPGGAFYLFPKIEGLGLTASAFAVGLLEEERVAVIPGDAFGAAGAGHVRCSFATGLDELKEAMARIARFVGRRRAAGS